MRHVVADASALLEYLLRTRSAFAARAVIEAVETDLHTVALCDVEVCSGLRRAILRGSISFSRAAEALAAYRDLSLTLYGHRWLLDRVLELRDTFSSYDAAYVALAERLGAALLTADAPLARAVGAALPLEVIEVSGRH